MRTDASEAKDAGSILLRSTIIYCTPLRFTVFYPGIYIYCVGLARSSPHKFFTHHVQRIAHAAIVGCARAMRAEVVKKKVSTIGGAHAPASAAHHAGSARR